MDIDFVVLWVDSNDPAWVREKDAYSALVKPGGETDANGDCRYRGEDEMLRFWFRGVEKNASWVHKVYFVSSGQVPEWMNTDHPSLVVVDHKDFIPREFLPTFNSRPIQFNLHRIKDLSEHFVLFDDDIFLLNSVNPDFFFRNGSPVLNAYLGYLNKGNNNWSRVVWNDYGVVNSYFKIKPSIWQNRRKWFGVRKLGLSYALYNYLCYKVNGTLPVYDYGHLAFPHLKSTIDEVWEAIPEQLRNTCINRFRSDDQLNHYLFSAWNQACGRFYPIPIDSPRGKCFTVRTQSLEKICSTIEGKGTPIICLNDSYKNDDPGKASMHIKESFLKIFPEKSSYER